MRRGACDGREGRRTSRLSDSPLASLASVLAESGAITIKSAHRRSFAWWCESFGGEECRTKGERSQAAVPRCEARDP